MKKLVTLCTVILTVILLAVILTGCQQDSATPTGTPELGLWKVTLEEASSIIGVTVPVPAYLPEGYEVQDIYIDDSTVILMISDEQIDTVPSPDELQSKIEMTIRWYSKYGIPVRLPVKQVNVNESHGFMQDRGDYNALWWNWYPNPGQPGMFELVLSADKSISEDELVKVAESVQQ